MNSQISSPSKVYYDVNITNFENVGQVLPPPVEFNETRSIPFLFNPSEYYLSIIRFSLDTPSLPAFIPSIQPNQNDPNLTIYSVAMEWTDAVTGITYYSGNYESAGETYIQYIPQINFPTPSPPSSTPSGLQDLQSGYYYVNSYQYFASLVNTALQTALSNLTALIAAQTSPDPIPTNYPATDQTLAPSLLFDPKTNLFGLTFDVTAFGTEITAGMDKVNPIRLIFNAPLYQLFGSFPSLVNQTSVYNKILILTDDLLPLVDKKIPSGELTNVNFTVFQEYSCIPLWTPINNIVFVSNTLPIVNNQLSAPYGFTNGKQVTYGQPANVSQVISDFIGEQNAYKPSILYEPKAEYRLIEMSGQTTPLQNLQIAVYWKDKFGNLIPFRLTSGSSATLKILFTRKDCS